MSRNGCDQMRSKAAFRIVARVRSALPILSVGCGLIRREDNEFSISDIVSEYTDTLSACQGVEPCFATRLSGNQNSTDGVPGGSVAYVSYNVIEVQQVHPATQQGAPAVGRLHIASGKVTNCDLPKSVTYVP